MKRSRLKKQSERGVAIAECRGLLREILRRKRGLKCELCGKYHPEVGLFHILPVGRFPNLQFHEKNVLLSCWMPCHYRWHHDYFKAKEIYKRIQVLRGDRFEEELKVLDKIQGALTLTRIKALKIALHWELGGM